jgi:hypothetical protein
MTNVGENRNGKSVKPFLHSDEQEMGYRSLNEFLT